MVKGNNMKNIIKISVLALLCSVTISVCAGTSVHAGNGDQDGCEKGGMDGLMNVSSEILNDQFKGLAGGSDYGMAWVCSTSSNRQARKGTLYFAKMVKAKVKAKATKKSPAVYYYTMYPDIALSSGAKTNVMMIGQVHSNDILTMENYARQIGVCATATIGDESSCPSGSKAKVVFNDGTTGYIFDSLPSYVHRQTNTGTGKMRAIQGYWARPYVCDNAWIPNSFNVGDEFECTDTNASINNDILKKAINEGKVTTEEVTVNNKKMTKVKLFLHHQWSGTADGSKYAGTANVSTIYLLVDYKKTVGWTDTFDAVVEAGVKDIQKSGDGVYYTDLTKATAVFTHKIKRESTNSGGNINEEYQIWYKTPDRFVSDATNPSPKVSTTVGLNDTNWHTVLANREETVDLGYGDNEVCDTIGWNKSVNNEGTKVWGKKDGCVVIHRNTWYDFSGKVEASTNATQHGDYYYTDTNTASLKFTHYLQRTTTNTQTRYKTSKDPAISNDFGITADYTDTTINKDNDWYAQKESPSTAKDVAVAKDNGSEYCQTLKFYARVSERVDWNNSNTYGSETTKNACVKLRRYKTTFTGNTEIYVDSSNVVDEEGNSINSSTNVAGKTLRVVGVSSYPAGIPLTFKHSVTRSNNDSPASPSTKTVAITTEVTRHDDVREGDPYGNALNETIGPLAKGGSGSKANTFTAQVYPEHSITLCQQMKYTSEIQGADPTATATAAEACVTIEMAEADCLGNKTFGIKNGSNWLKAEIYKNNATTATQSTQILETGRNHKLTEWAKPGDQIRYKYYGCAGGELARQYHNADTNTTSYTISTDSNAAGYLFGTKVGKDSNGGYNATSTTIGSSSSTDGTGPFGNDGSFTITVGSPTGELYYCNHYGNNNIKHFYRIPAYINGVSESNYRSNCLSDDYGRVSDLGHTITQYAEWSDIKYSNGSVQSGHDGSTKAKVTAEVKVPYNYRTGIKTSGGGGYIHPGSRHTEQVVLNVNRRKNELVNGDTEYDTVTKPSKYRLIQIVIDSSHTGSAEDFNDLVAGDELFRDDNGSKNLATDLTVCQEDDFNCSIVASSDLDKEKPTDPDPSYDSRNNGLSGQVIGSYTLSVPYNIEPGVKYCYLAAIWPSDSHNNPGLENITASANEVALKTGAIEGSMWHLSGATCFTSAKIPNIQILGGDGYAQRYITGHATKYPENNQGANPRIYSSWGEYGLIAGNSIQGFASGATLWGGSNIVSNKPNARLDCIYSSLTFANLECSSGKLGELAIDTTASSSPKNLSDQIKTRYTREDSETPLITGTGDTLSISNSGYCEYDEAHNKYVNNTGEKFGCIGDLGAKYTHVGNRGAQTASIQSTFCLSKGNDENNHISIIHSNGTLVIGANMLYGSGPSCTPESYASLNELPQYVLIANKIVIKDNVTRVDAWLVADEIITCDPGDDWAGTVSNSEINSKNCNKQLTINGPVLTKNIKLYRTYGAGFDEDSVLASPAEIFTMGPDVYLWSFGQAQRYSQATTTYSRELAPRY